MSKVTTDVGIVNFRALQIANQHRNAYGLRYNDYGRYRKHCANRTHRLRSTLKMTHGKGRDFKKLPPLNPENMQDGHLQLLLFESERAWAYSQELYTASLQPGNADKASTLRHSATGRFRRSIHWSTQLLSHCQSLYSSKRLSAENVMEAAAYTLILNGRFLRYRDEFEDALDQLCVARDLLDVLARSAETSRDQALATLYSDEISPEIRHCAHELGHTKSYDVDGIVNAVSPKRRGDLVPDYDHMVKGFRSEGPAGRNTEGRKRLNPIYWEGDEVPIRNPELVDVLLKVQAAEARLTESQSNAKVGDDGQKTGKGGKGHKSRNGVAAFDGILLTLSDAEDVSRKLVEAQQMSGGSSVGSVGTRDIHFIHSYIVYQLLARRIERDLTLISVLISTPQSHSGQKRNAPLSTQPKKELTDARVNPAIVKLLDTVLQSLTQMRTLNVVDESPDLANAVEARLAFTQSRRCLYLSKSYSVIKKYAEALSLIQRARLYLREASALLVSDTDPINVGSPASYPLTPSSFSDHEQVLTADEARLTKEWFTFNGGSVSAEKDLSKKPLFFDVALNYVQLDMQRLQERAGKKSVAPVSTTKPAEPKPAAPAAAKARMEVERVATPEPVAPARGGLSSLLGGWWGRQ